MSVREQLDAIREKYGYLDPEIVREEARPKTHPLHDRVFDRPPKEAAEAWYLHRAHELIQSVRVRYVSDDGRPKDVRAFLAVPGERVRPTYEPLEEVMQDDTKWRIVLAQMKREWQTLQARYGDLVEFVEMVRKDVGDAA